MRWRREIGGGYAGPAVANGRVYVADRLLAKGGSNPADPFARGIIPGTERLLCLDEADGSIIWQHEYECPYTIAYPAGPRATPVVSQGRVYTLGAEGDLFCLETKTGKVIWSRDFKKDYGLKTPLLGFAGHPLLDGWKLICLVSGEVSVAVAFDKDAGREIWRALSAQALSYAPPMIYEAGGQRQLILWHPESANSLDPETGKVHWTVPRQARTGLSVPTPRKLGDLLFFTAFYNGSLMLHLDPAKPPATPIWQTEKVSETETTHPNAIIPIPFSKTATSTACAATGNSAVSQPNSANESGRPSRRPLAAGRFAGRTRSS